MYFFGKVSKKSKVSYFTLLYFFFTLLFSIPQIAGNTNQITHGEREYKVAANNQIIKPKKRSQKQQNKMTTFTSISNLITFLFTTGLRSLSSAIVDRWQQAPYHQAVIVDPTCFVCSFVAACCSFLIGWLLFSLRLYVPLEC